VILLHSFGREFAPFISFSENFRNELSRNSPKPVDFFDFSLVTARFDDAAEAPFVAYLHSLFDERSVDLIVPMGGPAVRFAQKYRSQLFPDVPMLFASVDQRMIQYDSLTQNDAVVALRHEARPVVESILHLLPDTTNIVVVFGNTFVGRFWTDQFDQAIKEFAPGVGSELFSQLSYEEMMTRVRRLPPHSAIICGQILVDANGIPQIQDGLRALHSAANAPMFGLHDYQLGNGIVGGPLVSIREASHQSALAGARLLRGELPATIRPPSMGAAQPTYDWRELRRWRIPLASLPPDARIEFREQSPLDRYKWHIVTIVSICVAQALLIFLLLTNLSKRRRAEQFLYESEERMTLAADAARLGMWVWDPHTSQFWATEKWKEIHGYTGDLQYANLVERVHPEDKRAFENALSAATKEQGAFHLEHRIILPDGSIRWISKSGHVEQASNGAPARWLGISMDITERKENEAAAREASHKLITAREDERKRIARDLHDDLNQRLALLSIEMHLLGRMEKDSEAKEQIETITTLLTDVSSEVHKLSHQLHPANLEQLGLVAATRGLCQAFSKRGALSVEFNHDDIPADLDQKVALCLYRITQEALQNIIKHSHATHAKILLHRETDSIHLLVADNGQGFDMIDASHHASLGLVGMRERVKLVDGQITFQSVPGGGTQIQVVVPAAINAWNEDDFPPPAPAEKAIAVSETRAGSLNPRT
jgi:PAS domain S-box-containing protein